MNYKDCIYNFSVKRFNISSEDDILNDFKENITIIKDDININEKKVNNFKTTLNNSQSNVINNDDVIDPITFFNTSLNEIKNIIK